MYRYSVLAIYLTHNNCVQGISEYGFTAAVFLLSVLFLYLQLSAQCSKDGVKSAVICGTIFLVPMALWILCIVPCAYHGDACAKCADFGGSQVTQWLWHVLDMARALLLQAQFENVTTALYLVTCTSIAVFCAYSKPSVTAVSLPVPPDSAEQVLSTDTLLASSALPLLTVYVLVLLVALSWVLAQHFALGLLLSVLCIPSIIVVKSVCSVAVVVGSQPVKSTRWEAGRVALLLSVLICHMLLLR